MTLSKRIAVYQCFEGCWEGLGAGGERDDSGWDGWMASPTRRTWVWVNSGIRWWTGRPGMLQFMGSQRVGHDWVTELYWTEPNIRFSMLFFQIIPPSPSPTESKSLFFTSVSVLLSRIYCYHLSKFHIYALIYCIDVFLSDLFHSV